MTRPRKSHPSKPRPPRAAQALLIGALAFVALAGCQYPASAPGTLQADTPGRAHPPEQNAWDRDMPNAWVLRDPDTGCQYIAWTYNRGANLQPRLGVDGKPVCGLTPPPSVAR